MVICLLPPYFPDTTLFYQDTVPVMYSLLSLLGKRKGGRERREKKGDLSVTAVEGHEWNYFSMKLAHMHCHAPRLACKVQLASKDNGFIWNGCSTANKAVQGLATGGQTPTHLIKTAQ